ncbi:MAG TPA: hypothetical protein VGL53_17090 [Bryobacteraceae bacterium]|jgi:hypothetical protein
MDNIIWLSLPLFVAAGSALLCYFIMQSKMDVAISKERELLTEAHAKLRAQQTQVDEKVKAASEEVKRRALEEFLTEFRTEERSYMREAKTGQASRKSMVLQERLYFRNIPLSNWIETEMLVESSGDELPRLPSSFSTSRNVGSEGQSSMSRLLEQMGAGQQEAFSPAGD